MAAPRARGGRPHSPVRWPRRGPRRGVGGVLRRGCACPGCLRRRWAGPGPRLGR